MRGMLAKLVVDGLSEATTMIQRDDAMAWQVGVWDRMSTIYGTEVDPRFAPVVEGCLQRSGLRRGESVLDLGTGTGAVAIRAAAVVGPAGAVTAIDLSPEMLSVVRQRVAGSDLRNIRLLEGQAEQLPAEDGQFDAIVSSLTLMYVLDRATAARECARVLRSGGRFVAAVWAGRGGHRPLPGDRRLLRAVATHSGGGAWRPRRPRPLPRPATGCRNRRRSGHPDVGV